MIVHSDSSKYVCVDCRRKILADDLEAIFHHQLVTFVESEDQDLYTNWQYLSQKEKRIVIEQICDRIVIEPGTIHIEFSYPLHSHKAPANGQQNVSGNETPSVAISATDVDLLSEPLLSEAEAAKFLGISKMTLLRKRNAGNIGFFRVGFRILYSKEKHLIPYLNECEQRP